ncbi:PREDICTED: serine/threonine-protein kinase pdik1l-A-like [Branchiostoma belcheri]|uniref:Serine/threonine-protein kinase pdik1l-A-like n=1 Tax=Branchiostoma belcheri TaxID=7741 RepID=A0A6P4ZQ82_BRABE|nr:PREDICTED: serine/threonine-protein kinase pdik1l-A-like [Branchiostoma belcheri]KAI8501528.1 Serine/threonine-protein kinase pdik1l [Branchiostoma belcheri]
MDPDLEPYQVLDEIGSGSFGVVYSAISLKNSKHYAIKKIKCTNPENIEIALQEMWTLTRLTDHPNIVKMIECYLQNGGIHRVKHGEDDYLCLVEVCLKGKTYHQLPFSNSHKPCGKQLGPHIPHGQLNLWLVMEYCNGGTMNDYLLEREPDPETNARFMTQLSGAVSFLHDNNVVHRDLKPDNVLVCQPRNGDPPHVKIGDFGLSKICNASNLSHNTDINAYQMNSACGSDYFMAPEVFEGSYTAKADIFALGIIFCSMMERTTCYDKESNKLLLVTCITNGKENVPVGKALQDDPKLTFEVLKCGRNNRLKTLVQSMVAINPDERPTADVLHKKLQDIVKRQPGWTVCVTSQRVSKGKRKRRFTVS